MKRLWRHLSLALFGPQPILPTIIRPSIHVIGEDHCNTSGACTLLTVIIGGPARLSVRYAHGMEPCGSPRDEVYHWEWSDGSRCSLAENVALTAGFWALHDVRRVNPAAVFGHTELTSVATTVRRISTIIGEWNEKQAIDQVEQAIDAIERRAS